jgi:hypothetical protein
VLSGYRRIRQSTGLVAASCSEVHPLFRNAESFPLRSGKLVGASTKSLTELAIAGSEVAVSRLG